MNTLYEPRGRAAAYAKLAVNLYDQCSHGCRYCYCPRIIHKSPSVFYSTNPRPRPGLVDDLKTACDEWAAVEEERPTVHLCFLGDPLPMSGDPDYTAAVINLLHRYHFPVQLLSKSGFLPPVILKALGENDSYGVTITTCNQEQTAYWEPFAAPVGRRIAALNDAAECGIKTWVSLEPVLSVGDATGVLNALRGCSVSPVWVGRLNHYRPPYEWAEAKQQLAAVAREYDISVKWKDEL